MNECFKLKPASQFFRATGRTRPIAALRSPPASFPMIGMDLRGSDTKCGLLDDVRIQHVRG